MEILFVEDNLDEAELIENMLINHTGIHVHHVTTLTEALHRLDSEAFDVVLLDLSLPDSKGLDTLNRVLDDRPSVPVVVITGWEDLEFAFEALKAGAQDYLVKGKFEADWLIRSCQYARERMNVKADLAESEFRYQQLVEHSPIAIAIHQQGKIVYGNPKALELVKAKGPEDLIGTPAINMVHPDYRQQVAERIKNMYESGDAAPLSEEKFLCLDGTSLDVEVMASLFNFKGIPSVQVMIMDISDRKIAEEEIKKREERFSKFVEHDISGDYITNQNGLVYGNPRFLEIFGFESLEEACAFDIDSLYKNPEDRVKLAAALRTHGKVENHEVEYLDKYRNPLVILENVMAEYDKQGNVIQTLGYMLDITENKNNVTALIEAKEHAEEMNRLKTSFLANMSHELRTPMNGILGFSELMKEEENFANVKRMASIIHTSGQRLMSTLNQILDLSRLESGTEKPEITPTDILTLIRESITLFEAEALKKNIDLSLVSTQENLTVKTDTRIFLDILNNLINNAIKFTYRGKVTVTFRPEKQDDRNWIVVDVTDTGIGISPENLEIIFEEFRQISEGYSRGFEGSGLGLSLCKKHLKLLGGSIYVTSTLHVGSTFSFRIPATYEPSDSEVFVGKKETHAPGYNSSKKKKKVLYVEDDESSVILMSNYIQPLYTLDIALDAKDAISKMQKKSYDAILMDISLGSDMDGVRLLAHLRTMPGFASVPVIAVTAFAMKGSRDTFLGHGFDDYIPKPFDRKTLVELLHTILD